MIERPATPTFRIHLKNGISRQQFDEIMSRLGWMYRHLTPVTGGGRDLVIAIDTTTALQETAEWVANNRLWDRRSKIRVRHSHVEAIIQENVT